MKAWSYSSLTDFLGCPRRFHMVRDMKVVPFKETEAIKHGNEVHKALEDRIGKGVPLPEKYAQYEGVAAKFDKPGVFVEKEIALTRSLKPTGWWSKDCWVRGKIDVGIKAKNKVILADWKTGGKVRPESAQLQLFAAMEMSVSPEVEEAKTMFVWLQPGKTTAETFKREAVPVIWSDWINKAQRLETAYEKDVWMPKPSGLCGWCPLSKEHCEFRGSK